MKLSAVAEINVIIHGQGKTWNDAEEAIHKKYEILKERLGARKKHYGHEFILIEISDIQEEK